MSLEFWIVLLLVTAGLSAWIGYILARRNGPSKADVDALETRLDEARDHADAVQSGVNEHFEQSAVLFGRLANDYREFLDHFSASAQTLGVSENRARELLEQGLQPVLTHESGQTLDDEEFAEESSEAVAPAEADTAGAEETPAVEDAASAAEAPVAEGVAEPIAEEALVSEAEPDDIPVLQEPLAETEPPSYIVHEAESEVEPEAAKIRDVELDVPDSAAEDDAAVKRANP